MSTIIAGTYNVRDTGGMPLADGGTTRPGILYRADALGAVTPAGLETLASSSIGVIVDFRTAGERSYAPDLLPESRPFRTVHLSLLEGAVTGAAAKDDDAVTATLSSVPSLTELYIMMLTHAAPSFAEVARLIARPEDASHPGVLVHCTAGKDRTGVATALLLDAAGAERAAIVADYAASEANLAGEWADLSLQRMARGGIPISPELTELVTKTPPAAIEAALAWLDERGGSSAYLLDGGLSPDDLVRLRTAIAG